MADAKERVWLLPPHLKETGSVFSPVCKSSHLRTTHPREVGTHGSCHPAAVGNGGRIVGSQQQLRSGMGMNEALGVDLQELCAWAIWEGHICLYHRCFGKHCCFGDTPEILWQKCTFVSVTLCSSTCYPIVLYFFQLTLASLHNTTFLFTAS